MSAWNSNGHTFRLVTTTGDVVTLQDDVIAYSNTGAKAAAMLAATNPLVQLGKVYHFSNGNTGTLTLTPASGTIDGAATKVIAAGTAAAPVCASIIATAGGWVTFSN